MHQGFITFLVVIVGIIIINYVIHLIIVARYLKVRKMFQKEFPDHDGPLKMTIGQLIPEGTKFKDRIFKRSDLAEERLKQIFSPDSNGGEVPEKYRAQLKKIARLTRFHDIFVMTVIIAVIVGVIIFKSL